jgi:predicted nucleic acid-binding protein
VADLLLNTDIFVDHLRGARELDPRNHRVHCSVITRAELLAGTTASDSVNIVLGPFARSPSTEESPSVLDSSDARRAFDSLMR